MESPAVKSEPLIWVNLSIYRLIDPGSEWRLHQEWFKNSAMADLLDEDFSLVQKDNLYTSPGTRWH
jgi:hypothetical protein